ncbi:MAG: 50S ribosomal protein L21 [Paracoccaceae bacterium]|nr:50S ribosomal protein L21 [Paracoccaceae bacterium]MDE2675151.1 50S ribosomal protein L21 [Paracoccaceae bacterium]MDE2738695.1 50S ribosomal protein L21 [Paracoccaceae bacterium]
MDNSETLEDEEAIDISDDENVDDIEDTEDDSIGLYTVINPEVSAVFSYNGKQFPVKAGERCKILDLEVPEVGSELTVDTVMMGSGSESVMGNPYIPDAKIVLESLGLRTKKLISFKKRRRKHSSKTTRGYRQKSTLFMIKSIEIPGLPNSYCQKNI